MGWGEHKRSVNNKFDLLYQLYVLLADQGVAATSFTILRPNSQGFILSMSLNGFHLYSKYGTKLPILHYKVQVLYGC